MAFRLKDYQQREIDSLIRAIRSLLETGSSARIVFQSPTGSGKTIMMAETLKGLLQETLPKQYIFLWVSFYKIHLQSYRKIKQYLGDSEYQIMQLDDLQKDPLEANSLLFVNWHSLTTRDKKTGQYKNKFMRDREDGRTLKNILSQSHQDDKDVILIVDEAHQHYTSEQSRNFIDDIIKPVLRVEISATPQTSQGTLLDQRVIKVKLDDVIKSGLIKESCILNDSIGNYHIDQSSVNETVLRAALEKRKQLVELYRQSGDKDVNPLILIQLPSESEKLSKLDSSVLEDTEQLLYDNGINYRNKKLALWLSDKKQNLENIEDLGSPEEVLIFKQAVATGWDCPRAQILVMLREISSLIFKTQVIGRIMRMPKAHHYPEYPELNKAYVFSNLNDIAFDEDVASQIFYQKAKLKSNISNISLPKEHAPRQDYGDLTAIFSQILIDSLNKYFSITNGDILDQARTKIAYKLELNPNKLKTPLITDTIVSNINMSEDEMQRLDKKYIALAIADKDIQGLFNYLLKNWCQPYVPSRSISKMKVGLYRWFEKFGYDSEMTQRIVACSKNNQGIFENIIDIAKREYAKQHEKDIRKRNMVQFSNFSLPARDSFAGNYTEEVCDNYAYDKCYLQTKRSKPERTFEDILRKAGLITWWYKNGESQYQYFSITYKVLDEKLKITKHNNFYPDYICQFKDGSIGIYEIKSGDLDKNKESKRKALHEYLLNQKQLGLKGGLFDLSKEKESRLLMQDFMTS